MSSNNKFDWEEYAAKRLEIFPKDKSIYENYVCPRCFYTLDKCECLSFPHYSIWWIDKGIQEHIRILNKKGYKTEYSCESHRPQDEIYIVFWGRNFEDGMSMPEGFKYTKTNRTMRYKYGKDSKARNKMTIDEFEAEKKKALGDLLEWCKSLPE